MGGELQRLLSACRTKYFRRTRSFDRITGVFLTQYCYQNVRRTFWLLSEVVDIFVVAAFFVGIHAVADDEAIVDRAADVVGLDWQFAKSRFVEQSDNFQ